MTELNNREPLIGDGNTTAAIGTRDGKVIMQFPSPKQWLAMDPQNAALMGKAMIDAAVDLGVDVRIQAPKPQISEGLRIRMEARCLMILKNKREHTEKDPVLARRLVDTILNMHDL